MEGNWKVGIHVGIQLVADKGSLCLWGAGFHDSSSALEDTVPGTEKWRGC